LETNPIFYVNIATQLKFLQNQQRYIACTSDKIFEKKQAVYDVFINIVNDTDDGDVYLAKSATPKKTVEITVQDIEDRDILNLTDGDIARYNFITRNFQAADEARVLSFLMELNNKIFYGLNKASKRNSSFEPENLPKIGLDPSDFLFFQELVRFYDLEVTPVTPCCYGCCV